MANSLTNSENVIVFQQIEDISNGLNQAYADISNLDGDVVQLQVDVGGLQLTTSQLATDVANLQLGAPIGMYYKTASQPAPSGATTLTWDTFKSWSDVSVITLSGNTDFVVNQGGVYQLEANLLVDASGSSGTSNKVSSIHLIRGSDLAVIADQRQISSGSTCAVCLSAPFELDPGDILNIRFTHTITGVASIRASSGFDLNNWFSFRLLKLL